MSATDRAHSVANYGLRRAEDGPVFRVVPHELTEALAADVLALASALEDAERERDVARRDSDAAIALTRKWRNEKNEERAENQRLREALSVCRACFEGRHAECQDHWFVFSCECPCPPAAEDAERDRYRALAAAERAAAGWERTTHDLAEERAENQRLREALSFYVTANLVDWSEDWGKRAREALAEGRQTDR